MIYEYFEQDRAFAAQTLLALEASNPIAITKSMTEAITKFLELNIGNPAVDRDGAQKVFAKLFMLYECLSANFMGADYLEMRTVTYVGELQEMLIMPKLLPIAEQCPMLPVLAQVLANIVVNASYRNDTKYPEWYVEAAQKAVNYANSHYLAYSWTEEIANGAVGVPS